MPDQNLNDLLSDSSPDYSQACSPAFTSQPVNEYVITRVRSSSFGGGTGSSLQLNEIFIRQRVMNQQHQGRTTQSQSRSQDLAYTAQQVLTEFMNANRAAEPHLQQASSNRLCASSNSGSQRNNQSQSRSQDLAYTVQQVLTEFMNANRAAEPHLRQASSNRLFASSNTGSQRNNQSQSRSQDLAYTVQQVLTEFMNANRAAEPHLRQASSNRLFASSNTGSQRNNQSQSRSQDLAYTAQQVLTEFMNANRAAEPHLRQASSNRLFASSNTGSQRNNQSQSRSQDLAYTAQQVLTEFMNANRAAEPHLRQASSNRLFASCNSGSQRNNQIGIAHDAWDILSNLHPGASNTFTRGNSSNRQANDGSSLFHGHGTVMQHAYNRDSRIQTNIQCPCPVHGQMHCRPSPVGVNVTPMNMHHTALIYRENFLGAAPEVIMNALPTTAISPDMPHQTHSWHDISAFIPGDVDTILTELLPLIHDPNLAADVIDTFAMPTDMQGPFAHEQHFPGVISSDLHTGPANSQMYFVPGQNISRASPVVVSQNPISLQGPLDGQSSSAVVLRDKRIPTNTQRPPVSGQNLSSAVPRDTNKTLIDEQGCNHHQGESFSNAVPRDTEKSSIYESKPSAHRQGLFIPLPADTNAFARESVAKSSIATQGQTFSPGQFIPLSADTNVFARGSAAESSIATQGQTSSQGDTNAFARFAGSAAGSSVATQVQTSSQGLFLPSSGSTNAFARFAGSAAGSLIATQVQTSSQGLFIASSGSTNAFARFAESAAESSVAAQGQTSSQGLFIPSSGRTNAFARFAGSAAVSSVATQGQTSSQGLFSPSSGRTNAFARLAESAAGSSVAAQGQTSSQGLFSPSSGRTNAFARFAESAAGSSVAAQGQTFSQGLFSPSSGRTNAFARFAESAAGSSVAAQGQTSSQGLFSPSSGRTNAFARFAESAAGSSVAAQGQTSSQGLFSPSSGRINAFARFTESAAGSSVAAQGQTSSQGLFSPSSGCTNAFARFAESAAGSPVSAQESIPLPADTDAFAKRSVKKSSIAAQEQTSSPGQSIPLPADTDAFVRRSVEKSSIAAQGQTSVAKSTNAFARKSVAKSSIAAQEQTSSQDLSIPQSGRTKSKALARKSVAKSSIAAQEQTTLEPPSKRIKNNSEGGWNLAVEQSTKLGSSMFNQSSATAKDKSLPSLLPTPQEGPIHHVRTQEEFKLVGEKCQLCNIDMAFNPTGSTSSSSHNNTILPIPAVLPCGHCYHYDCLKRIYGSPGKGEVPPCIHCSEGVASSKD